MLKKVALVVAGLLVVFIAVVATRPDTVRVERSLEFAAPPAAVFPLVNDFHKWGGWSPWDKLDPNQKRDYEGASAGTGAIYHWSGNDQVGEGRMTITDSREAERVSIKLEFLKPWASTNQTTFVFAPSGSGTRVTWSMDAHNDFKGKMMMLFMNLDKMVGPDFEKGLAQMKTLAEGTALAGAKAPEHG